MWIRTAVLSLTAVAMTLTGAGVSAAPVVLLCGGIAVTAFLR